MVLTPRVCCWIDVTAALDACWVTRLDVVVGAETKLRLGTAGVAGFALVALRAVRANDFDAMVV